MEKELKLINVNKKYKLAGKQTFQALYDINIEFEKGELVSIVGESGSGKSTLMNLIGGLDSDFTGDIIAGGENLRKLSDKQLDKYRKNKVGFVFQSFNLISHLSILDNVTLSLTLSNVSEKQKVKKATEILKRVGLSTQLKRKPTQLSGGQKQRVAIARALINDPEIIIADEPTGSLDSTTSMQILEILKEIADSGKLVIMVTHSEKVASVSSRVVEISDGRIISDKINEKYKRKKIAPAEKPAEKVEETTKKKKKSVNYKDRQTLTLWQAIRLSMHNMWASKTKNFLMAFGVAIGIGSLILMMCFSSGITDYITNTSNSFSDPTIVTISKKNTEDSSSGSLISSLLDFSYTPFDEDENEIETLIENINNYLAEQYESGKLSESFTVTEENISRGVQMYTISTGENSKASVTNTETDESLNIFCIYTIPPYYTSANVATGEMCTSEGGVMFSSKILELFENGSIYNDDGSARTVKLSLSLDETGGTNTLPYTLEEEVTGIMDISILSGYLVMYVDYDYLQDIYEGWTGTTLNPNILYIQTSSEEITNAINTYIAAQEGYTGSIEDQLSGVFSSMSSVIGTSLIIISCISLIVSAMMILVVLYMSVTERTKEIGVLKSIGARRKDIRRIFTSESFLIGLLSGIVGIVFNLILTGIVYLALINLIGIAPLTYRWWYFAVAIGVSVVISMLSGLYPANKASKLDPVESLRRE